MIKNFTWILVLTSLIALGCSDEFQPPTGPTSQNDTVIIIPEPTPLDTVTWSVTTDLKVSSGQISQTADIVIGHSGEFHVWLLMKYDAREKYMIWVVFNYQDGTKKLFPVPDLYAERPSTVLFDVGMAAVEDTLSVTLLIEKLSTPSASLAPAGTLCDGWDRLLEIHGSAVVPKTSASFDRVIRLDPKSGKLTEID